MFVIGGMATPYNVAMTEQRNGRRLAFDRFAFSESIRRNTVYFTVNHDKFRAIDCGGRALVAIQADDSLKLEERVDGLFFSARIDGLLWEQYLRRVFHQGSVRGASIRWDPDNMRLYHCGGDVYVVREVGLVHVSVTIAPREPAFPQTYVRILDDTAA